jgi:hypothetical protein
MIRTLIIATTLAAALCSSSAFTQERGQGAASIPDFSGVWGNPYLYGIEPPLSGPGPVVNKVRQRQLRDAAGRKASPSFSQTMPCNCCSGPTASRCFTMRITKSDVCV